VTHPNEVGGQSGAFGLGMSEKADVSPIADVSGINVPE